MTKKRYTSARGQEINFDLLVRENQKTVAVGNANLNAKGDLLGPGGKIIETSEEILKKAAQTQAADPNTAYNQDNPNAIKMVSIKDSVNLATSYHNAPSINEDKLKTPAEALGENKMASDIIDEKSKKKENKRKIVDKED